MAQTEAAFSGMDMSCYNVELAKMRMNNSISIRRPNIKINHFDKNKKVIPRAASLEHIAKYSPDQLLSAFRSGDDQLIERYTRTLCEAIEEEPSLLVPLLRSDDVMEAITESISKIETESGMASLCELFILFTKKDDVAMIDNGFLFTIRDYLALFPVEVLNLYGAMATISGYARNTFMCLGIIDDVIDMCSNTDNENLKMECCQCIYSMFSHNHPFEVDAVQDIIEKVVSILGLVPSSSYLLATLANISITLDSHNSIQLFELKVHEFLVSALDVEELVPQAVLLAEQMAICDFSSVSELIKCELVQKISQHLDAQGSLIFFANCFESAPDLISSLLDTEFINLIASVLVDSPYQILKEADYLTATLFMFAPISYVEYMMTNKMTDHLLDMLDGGVGYVVYRCLEAIERVIIIASSNNIIRDSLEEILASSDAEVAINNLVESPDLMISEKAISILKSIDSCK